MGASILLVLLGITYGGLFGVIDDGLDRLAALQRDDGSWSAEAGYSDREVTALALQAFLTGGQTHRHGVHREVVGKGLAWMKANIRALPAREHAMCACALATAYELTGSPLFKRPAMKAAQRLEGAWMGERVPGDLETAAWSLAALEQHGRKPAGDAALVAKVRVHLESHPPKSAREFAQAAWIRLLIGEDPLLSEDVRESLTVLTANRPRWEEGEEPDFAYWFFGSQVFDRAHREDWVRWRVAVEVTLLDSRSPGGTWEVRGSRAVATAFGSMCVSMRFTRSPCWRRRRPHRNPTTAGLSWLAGQQTESGAFEGTKAISDPAATGFVVLAFLGAGETHKHGTYKSLMKRALLRLVAGQTEGGRLVPEEASEPVRDHAVATLALAEAYALTGSPKFKGAAQNAIRHLSSLRNDGAAWGSIEATTWAVAGLRTAKISGLEVGDGHVAGVRAALASRKGTDLLTASATAWIRVMLGDEPVDIAPPAVPGPDDVLAASFGHHARFRARGERWRDWDRALYRQVADSQNLDGSWDPAGAWGKAAGRAVVTAILVRCTMHWYIGPSIRMR